MSDLAAQQEALVAALVAGADVPEGFNSAAVLATISALRRKRAGEVAHRWPFLAASYGDAWVPTFSAWAAGRPPNGSLRDGWDFARCAGDTLPPLAREELADRERDFTYDGRSAPAPKRRGLLSRFRR
ncbi:hypothetical protein [Dactylosporangium sp. CA-139066]|uniref:hypothetical protein n=1 Tax=Dactylosporangium sp. CA-139066 TaxID=3239930 RepID=UPI003D90FFAC